MKRSPVDRAQFVRVDVMHRGDHAWDKLLSARYVVTPRHFRVESERVVSGNGETATAQMHLDKRTPRRDGLVPKGPGPLDLGRKIYRSQCRFRAVRCRGKLTT